MIWLPLALVFLSVEARPNFIIIITDDQDVSLRGMTPLKKTKTLLADQGVTFGNAFTTTPICCPSRASFLTGLYQHSHGVVNNTIQGGCSSRDWQMSHERVTFATELKKLNYSTFYAGKYLNQYGSKNAGGPRHVPPGWDSWVGLIGNSKYYNYSLSINGTRRHFKNEYLTRILECEAVKFLDNHKASEDPFLMVLAPPAPHSPFTPEPAYAGAFKGTKIPRTPHFNYPNNTDKHWLARMGPSPLPKNVTRLMDKLYASRWETLLTVDDLVETIVNKLTSTRLIKNTYVVFTSDNGFHLGQFAMAWDKRQPYEFDIRVPLLVRGPGLPAGQIVQTPVLLIDIAPTLYHVLNVSVQTDGRSFIPLGSGTEDRSFIVEYQGEGSVGRSSRCFPDDSDVSHCLDNVLCKCQDSSNNTYTCYRSITKQNNTIFCMFNDNEMLIESYDLTTDPFQLKNVALEMSEKDKRFYVTKLRQSSNLP